VSQPDSTRASERACPSRNPQPLFLPHILAFAASRHRSHAPALFSSGDLRKTTKLTVAGQEIEVQTMVSQQDDETVNNGTAQYANRESFITIRDRCAAHTHTCTCRRSKAKQ
jgi:hypothetical protein